MMNESSCVPREGAEVDVPKIGRLTALAAVGASEGTARTWIYLKPQLSTTGRSRHRVGERAKEPLCSAPRMALSIASNARRPECTIFLEACR